MTDASFAQGLVGVTLDGRYRLDAVLGEGGMGAVFRATQLAMDRKVAVKLLKPHLTSDQAALQRFSREARATLKVESPHAVKVLDFGVTPLGDYYMVLEYLDGRTVQRELEIDGPFAPRRVAHIARQALHALGTAHAQGLIHRDVKPENLLLMRVGDDADYTKILDFGVAKLMQGSAGDPALLALTAAGMVFGTPEFMSPEQACGQPLDGRSDLYSLAATMFVMLTGTTLFEGHTAIEWLTHHARTPPPLLAMARPELAVYPELDALLQRCLAKDREQRPATAAEMAGLITALEPTLVRAPAGDRRQTASKPTQIHASSYVEVLRDTDPTEHAISPPPVQWPVESLGPSSTATTGISLTRSRRGPYRWLGGIAIASLIGTAIGLSMHRFTSRSTSISAAPPVAAATPTTAASPTTAGSPVVAADPGPGAPTADAGTDLARDMSAVASQPPPGPAPPRRSIRAPAPPRNPEAEEHLRAAEEALQSGPPLRQLAEAHAALRADPRSVRARYLIGDALIKSGDLDHGCKYLAAAKHLAAARDRARAAGCPSD